MVAALYIAHRRGIIAGRQAERMENLIYLYGPLSPLKLRAARLVAAAGADKKNIGGVRRFVLPLGIGEAGVVEDVTAAELEAAARFMLARAAEVHASGETPSPRESESATKQQPILIASPGR